MEKQIPKKEIESFLLEFSRVNQFRPMVVDKTFRRKTERIIDDSYFLGFHCVKEINSDRVVLFKATMAYQYIGEIVLDVIGIKKVVLFSENEIAGVVIQGDGVKYTVKVFGRPNEGMRRETIAKVAYFVWERKGGLGSQDIENWAEAERIITDWKRVFSEGFIKI